MNYEVFPMEKEIRQLTEQRDLAQSRIEDLLLMVGKERISRNEGEDVWENDSSVSEASSTYSSHHRPDTRIREFNNPHYNHGGGGRNPDGPDEYCKEVRCVELEESSKDNSEDLDPSLSVNEEAIGTSQEIASHVNEGNSTFGVLEQRLHDVQSTIDSLVGPYPDENSSQVMARNMSSHRNLKLTRSRSCTEYQLSGSPEIEGETQRTPAYGFDKEFPGRPDGLWRKFPPLNYDGSAEFSRNDSQSSVTTSADEDITSIQTFVAGMKEMIQHEYEKQLVDGQDQETEKKPFQRNVKNTGVDPMLEAPGTPLDWSLQFKRQQKEIIELWQSCCVPLTHRTYFFLLFRGDPKDSIYMEVEIRRLSFLKETIFDENQSDNDSQIITLASSVKALRREREMLVKLMQKRLSEEERKRLFKEWDIALKSKRRRMQLANRLWSNTDMNHIMQSATVVAKLVRFSEQGKALKEMFGLSFTPQLTRRRSNSWKNGRASLP